MLTSLELCAGIGGITRAAEWAGFETVGLCERDKFALKVLNKHWPHVPKWEDIHDVTAKSFRERVGIDRPTLVCAGLPCQPHSLAGQRKASCDERDLWGEAARVVREIRPRWFLGENVRGLLSSESGRFFGRVLRDLADAGYTVGWHLHEAAEVGAPHRRARVFIVGYNATHSHNARFGTSEHGRHSGWTPRPCQRKNVLCNGAYGHGQDATHAPRQQNRRQFKRGIPPDVGADGQDVTNAESAGQQSGKEGQGKIEFGGSNAGRADGTIIGQIRSADDGVSRRLVGRIDGDAELMRWHDYWQSGDWWCPPTAVGEKDRVNKLRCLGNAVVPTQVYPILREIANIEREMVA